MNRYKCVRLERREYDYHFIVFYDELELESSEFASISDFVFGVKLSDSEEEMPDVRLAKLARSRFMREIEDIQGKWTETVNRLSVSIPGSSNVQREDDASLPSMEVVKGGRYRHFKGNVYQVLDTATDSETGKLLVIYQNEAGERYARPVKMFLEYVSVDGSPVPRFSLLKD